MGEAIPSTVGSHAHFCDCLSIVNRSVTHLTCIIMLKPGANFQTYIMHAHLPLREEE